jgi:hypothetical protein
MSRVRPAFLLVFATGLTATAIAAEPAEAKPAANEASPVVATPASAPVAPRAISPATALKLTAPIPKFVATPTRDERTAAAPSAPATEEIKPRNTIIRLPDYVVRDAKVPAIKEREVLTPSGRLELARKLHPGIRVGNLFGLNDGWALAMLAEQERLDRQREFGDLADLMRYSDPAMHAKVKREVQQAFMREADFGR